ncbi:MAG TPA: 5,6-dimethylbenzimidazole synthase [Burkholderiaceae bacterium]|nr:5,6-dimethylbenzimidazole synthase [Burkholderiaceae bacterium]
MERAAELTDPVDRFEQARAAVYQNIFTRRDVRSQFLPDQVSDVVLSRVLMAAHHAPSVGFMQPWNFLVIRSKAVRQRVHAAFLLARAEEATKFDNEKEEQYRRLKLEGILEAPINICVTCDHGRAGPAVLGRTHNPATDIYSTVCAVQNLWLAARAEGLGVGWVSIFRTAALQNILGIPTNISPIAYLCVGYVSHFLDKPELELAGWRSRTPLEKLVFFDQWGQDHCEWSDGVVQRIRHIQERERQGAIAE